MSVCIIPARGGSKRIPRKNIREFCGKPMIAWSIETALESEYFSRVVVSTDDTEIGKIAQRYGAEVPFYRPTDLADDYAPTVPVIAHAISGLNLPAETPVCCLYATAPFVKPKDLQETRELLLANPNSFIFPVTTFSYPIQRALRRDAFTGQVRMCNPDMAAMRSQDLEEAWHDAGQFYWALANLWQLERTVFQGDTIGYPVSRYRVQDIDTIEDWKTAEQMMKVSQRVL